MKLLIYGLATGFLFGFFLQKGRVLRYDRQVGALRLMDMTIFKFMLSAIVVGMVGIFALYDLGLIKLRMMPLVLGPNIVGGAIFGIGWGFLGYCPGTAVGALGEGRWDALWGILGMISGAALYALTYPALESTGFFLFGKTKIYPLSQLLGVNHWFIIPVFVTGVVLMFRWFEKKGL